MNHDEILKEMTMDYDSLVKHLLSKYGVAKYDYFTDPSCKFADPRKSRTKEGLFCHHIDEDKGIALSDKMLAVEQPFEYQKAERLVYCNYLEHLMLHIQIGKNKYWEEHSTLSQPEDLPRFLVPGITFITHDINTVFKANHAFEKWQQRCFMEISDNFDSYIYILQSFIKYLRDMYSGIKIPHSICVNQHILDPKLGDGVIVSIDGDSWRSEVVMKYGDHVISRPRYKIDNGGFEEYLLLVKRKLSLDNSSSPVEIVYEKLKNV